MPFGGVHFECWEMELKIGDDELTLGGEICRRCACWCGCYGACKRCIRLWKTSKGSRIGWVTSRNTRGLMMATFIFEVATTWKKILSTAIFLLAKFEIDSCRHWTSVVLAMFVFFSPDQGLMNYFGGIKECKRMVIWMDLLFKMHCLGWFFRWPGTQMGPFFIGISALFWEAPTLKNRVQLGSIGPL